MQSNASVFYLVLSLPDSQKEPKNPSKQLHRGLPSASTVHVPSLKHGFGVQLSLIKKTALNALGIIYIAI